MMAHRPRGRWLRRAGRSRGLAWGSRAVVAAVGPRLKRLLMELLILPRRAHERLYVTRQVRARRLLREIMAVPVRMDRRPGQEGREDHCGGQAGDRENERPPPAPPLAAAGLFRDRPADRGPRGVRVDRRRDGAEAAQGRIRSHVRPHAGRAGRA